MVMMAGLGPPLLRIQMTNLWRIELCISAVEDSRIDRDWIRLGHGRSDLRTALGRDAIGTYGLAAQKANRKPVLIQLMALSETSKYCAAVVEMEEKVSHCLADVRMRSYRGRSCLTSQLTTIFSSTS